MSETMKQGILVRGFGGFYVAADADGVEYTLRCKKKFRRMKLSPLVGDEVMFTPGQGEEEGWVEEILPRRTSFIRPPVANVSLLLVNKCDVEETLAEELRGQYAGAECPVMAVSAVDGRGLGALREAMAGELCCLAGQSGVGKSTLINAILGLDRETGEISRRIQRGKNTTRHAELLLSGGMKVLDTAGFSLLELEGGMEPVTLKDYYPEFLPHEGACRFSPCYHDREPGCAVIRACDEGQINHERLARYRLLLADVKQAWRERYD